MSSENQNDPIFGAKTADLHSLSGHVSDWIFLSTFTSLNDNMLCVSPDDGWYLGVYVKKGFSTYLLFGPMETTVRYAF